MKDHQITMARITDIRVADFNPAKRTDAIRMRAIIESIERDGFHWYHPLLIGSDGILGDGHRRLEAARALGVTEVPVLYIHDKTAAQLFMDNEASFPVSNSQWLQVYVAGVRDLPPKRRAEIERLVSLVGEDVVCHIAAKGQTTRVLQYGLQAAAYCERQKDTEFLKAAVIWTVELNQSAALRRFIEDDGDPAVLEIAIAESRPLSLSWNAG